MYRSILFLVLAAAPQQESGRVPAELAAAQAYRDFVNGRVLWTFQGLPPNAPTTGISEYDLSFTREQILLEERHPVVMTRTVSWEGRFYNTTDGSSLTASARRRVELPLPDARTLGMTPYGYAKTLDEAIHGSEEEHARREYEVTSDGPYRLVTTTVFDDGNAIHSRIKQWIDPARGWSVVRAQLLDRDGAIRAQSVTRVAEQDGMWFPRSVTLYRRGDVQNPIAIVNVNEVRLNDPDLPSEFTPTDIGIQPGTNVSVEQDDGRWKIMGWNGKDIEPWGKMVARLRRGEIELGPDYQVQIRAARQDSALRRMVEESIAERHGKSPFNRTELTDWQRYVMRFIDFYGLDAEQAARAWAIHDDCAERAQRYLDGKRAEFDELDREFARAKGAANTAELEERLTKVARRRADLLLPLVRIFEKELKPRLRSLLTRKQLEKGELEPKAAKP